MADVEYRVFVGGLSWTTDSEALERAFSSYGEIVDSKVVNDRETGRSRGFEFVTFTSEKSMRDAIHGRNITVLEAQARGGGGGGGRGRGYGGRGYGRGGCRDGGGYGG